MRRGRATSPSSWTATRAGRRAAGCRCSTGHRAGADRRQGAAARRGQARGRGADGLLVLDRELVAPDGRGGRPDGDVRRADRPRDARAARGGRADALHRPPRRGLDRSCGSRWTGPRSSPREQRPDHALRRLQLRRPGGDRRRGANLHRRRRRRSSAPPLRARHARPRPADPHERRAARLELPALADARTRSSSSATSCGPTSTRRRSRRRSRSTRRASAGSGRRLAMAARPRRAAPGLGPRRRAMLVAIPAIIFARRSSSARAALVCGARIFALGRGRAGRAVQADGPRAAARTSPASSTLGALCARGARTASHFHDRPRAGRVVPGHVLPDARCARGASTRRGRSRSTSSGCSGSAWRWRTPCWLREPAARRQPRGRRAGRHVRRRHRRLLRRALLRAHPARAADLAEQDARGPRAASLGGDARVLVSPGCYQDWLAGVDALVIGARVALAAPVGDLFESMIKRDLEVKDTGSLFGAHGGVLDRLDAVLFTVPVGLLRGAVGLGLRLDCYTQRRCAGSSYSARPARSACRRSTWSSAAAELEVVGLAAASSWELLRRAGARATASSRIALADADAAARAAEALGRGRGARRAPRGSSS